MDFLIQPLAFIFVLSVVVFIHEMGHFLVARFYGVAVETFSIGFGKEIVGWTDSKGTRWKVSWLPLGGYVKFLGDENAASVPDAEKLAEMKAQGITDEGVFYFKPLYQRAAVVAAGPVANFILAIVVFMALSMIVGLRFTTPRIDAVKPESPAAEAGFLAGDVITSVDGSSVDRFEMVRQAERLNTGTQMRFTVQREGQEVSLTATPERVPFEDRFGNRYEMGELGFYPRGEMVVVGLVSEDSAAAEAGLQAEDWILAIDGDPVWTFPDLLNKVSESAGKPLTFRIDRAGELMDLAITPRATEVTAPSGATETQGRIGIGLGYREGDVVWIRFGPFRGIAHGADQTWGIISQTFTYIGGLFAGTQSTDQLSGPIRIFQLTGQAASVSFVSLISLMAVLSVSIGLINLFPIPILDGGHLLFYAYEAVAGKPLNERVQEVGFRIGLALILALMVFVTWNDVMLSWFSGNG